MCKSILRKITSDQRGTIATFTALLMPIVIGGLGLGAEASFWYFTQRKLQNSADVAAFAGAAQLRTNRSQQLIENAALAAAVKTGYNTSNGTITAEWPAANGTYAGDINTVEITVSESLPRLLTSLFSEGNIALSGRAVAELKQGFPTCILALDPDASGAVTFTGSSDATLESCNVHANSLAEDSVVVTGSGKVSTPCVSAAGGVSATSGLTMDECATPIEYADPVVDPFADVPEPYTGDPCEPENTFAGKPSSTYTISEGRYCGGLTIKRTVTMNPGVYVVDGGSFAIESTGLVEGTDVTIYLTNGATVSVAGTADINLTAPNSGDYKNILIFVDRNNPNDTHIFNGSSDSTLNGAVYAANGHVEYAGTSTVGGGCTQIVAKTVEITGDAGIGSDCTLMGFNEIKNEQMIALVE
ncbi:putative membrane protein [Roseibium album]|nr:putative membrane protein [Roseibium album]